jgi:acyl transferase domain-containing protein
VQAPHSDWQHDSYTTRIAAVACCYPQPADGADAWFGSSGGLAGFWAALQGGANLQRVVPASRWDIDAVYTPDTAAKCALFVLL